MQDVRFYDFEFNLLHIENDIISLEWYLKFNGIGNFEIHLKADGDRVRIIMSHEYMVAIQGDRQAIITGKQIVGNELILYGRTVNWILSKRVTPKFSTYKADIGTNAEDIARWAVSEAFGDVDNFVLAEKVGLDYDKEFWRNVYNPTSEVVTDCLDNAKAGHKVVFDLKNKRWVFSIYKGKDNPLVVSVGHRNVYSMTYDEDLQDYCGSGWYEAVSDDDGQTESRWECVSKNDGKTGIYRWEGVLGGTSNSEAVSSLASRKWEKDCQVKSSSLHYGADYELGDIMRVQYEFGSYKVSRKCRAVGVKVWYECGNIGEIPIFDDI